MHFLRQMFRRSLPILGRRGIRFATPGVCRSILHSLDTCRRRILVRGIVQGVGFRPFVHNLAQMLEPRGFVRNSAAGVVIEAEGRGVAVDRSLESIRTHPPPLAQVDEISISALPPQQTRELTIEESAAEEGALGLASSSRTSATWSAPPATTSAKTSAPSRFR